MKPSAETEPNSNSSQPIKLDNSSESNVKNEIIDISYNSTDDKSYEINVNFNNYFLSNLQLGREIESVT